ncbi:MAG TPA: hypothetical protein VHQ43_01020 [Solirubrobacterales bacterium]|jgi:hypothetical protein|nr:hypothetical protein [Solirubrobacterales bacterium]
MNRVDLEHRYIEENVWITSWILDVTQCKCLVLALGNGPGLGDVLGEAVLAGLFGSALAFAPAALRSFGAFGRLACRFRAPRRRGLLGSHHPPPFPP